MIRWIALGLAAIVLGGGLWFWLWLKSLDAANYDPAYFEEAIVAFEAADRSDRPQGTRRPRASLLNPGRGRVRAPTLPSECTHFPMGTF